MKKSHANSDKQQTVFNYLSLIFIYFFFSFLILSIISFEKSIPIFVPIALLSFNALWFIFLYNTPVLIKYSAENLEIVYLLKKRKQIRWSEITYVLDPILRGNIIIKIIYRIDSSDKHVTIPKTKKNLKMLEIHSKLKVIDQYQYKSIKEKEYKNQFKK